MGSVSGTGLGARYQGRGGLGSCSIRVSLRYRYIHCMIYNSITRVHVRAGADTTVFYAILKHVSVNSSLKYSPTSPNGCNEVQTRTTLEINGEQMEDRLNRANLCDFRIGLIVPIQSTCIHGVLWILLVQEFGNYRMWSHPVIEKLLEKPVEYILLFWDRLAYDHLLAWW